MQEMYCLITGKVQNVAYRVYAQDSASELGLSGWVRNLDDGSVELVAQGDKEVLKDFVEYLYEGSLRAQVESIDIHWQSPRELLEDFSIRYV